MTIPYSGTELELFQAASNWKRYFASVLAPFIGGDVLEVGAGMGSNISYLLGPAVRAWTSLEPDPALAALIRAGIARGALPASCRVVDGTTASAGIGGTFDSILYIDVLEHIADDAAELERAAALLSPGGNLVVLAPAHQFLFSPFDTAIGHFRRYDRASLTALQPRGCSLRRRLMLDSAGFFASLANRLLLAAALPTPRQIAFWDKVLVPVSRASDVLTAHRFGKTVVGVWQRTD